MIVVGPELRLISARLPKKMARALQAVYLSEMEERGAATDIKSAKRLVENEKPEVWDVLDEVIKEHPIF